MSDSGSRSDVLAGKPPRASQIPRWVAASLLVVSLSCFILLLTWNWASEDIRFGCDAVLNGVLNERGCTAAVNKIFTYAWALALVPLLFLLERVMPADEEQPLFSQGLLVDSLWFVTFPLLGVWLINSFEHLLGNSFVWMADLRLQVLASLPLPVQFLIVILISDFLSWFGHLLRHKVPSLWEMHKIHHSQLQLNVFSTRRLHPLDSLAQSLIRFLPWTLLGLTYAIPGYLVWSIILRLWEMVVHSNIRTNLGFLRYVIVTPQTHRIHHSALHRHIDKNFGNFFSIWDFMFGTQCKEFGIYPKLGIADEKCPTGGAKTVWGAIKVFGSELVYPFRALRALHFGAGPKTSHGLVNPVKKVPEV